MPDGHLPHIVDAGPVGAKLRHDSAHLHVSGAARYVDDIPEPPGCLHLAVAMSDRAHARILEMDLSPVRAMPGVVAVFSAEDIPGVNDVGPVVHDDPVFAAGRALYHGQSLFAVAAETVKAARMAARAARIVYEDAPALLDIDAALAAGSFIEPS